MGKTCSNCKKIKDHSEYNWKDKKKGKKHSFCKDCQSKYRRQHYLKNRSKYLIKARKWNKAQTLILRQYIVEYFSKHSCVDCGAGDIRVLDFDHEVNKKMGVAQMVRNCHSLKSLEKEISKCKVRCANCHRIKTFSRGNYWKHKMGL